MPDFAILLLILATIPRDTYFPNCIDENTEMSTNLPRVMHLVND